MMWHDLIDSSTWHRLSGFSLDTWHSLISAIIWGTTFFVLFAVPIKRTREWTPLAAGLTAISGILAIVLFVTSITIVYPSFKLDAIRYLFRDVGSIVNIVIIWKVFWPGKDRGREA